MIKVFSNKWERAMSEKVPLTIELTPHEEREWEEFALQQGYKTTADFVRALVSDAMADYNFDTKEGILAGLRESFHQAVTGNTRPVSELWDYLDTDG